MSDIAEFCRDIALKPVIRLLTQSLLGAALVASAAALAKDEKAAPKVQAVTVGMGNFEPYFVSRTKSGVFADVIQAVFDKLPGYEPVFVFGHSNRALWASFEAGRVDAVANVFEAHQLGSCRSEPAFRFRDVAVSLADSQFAIDSIEDLRGKSLVTFEGAQDFFGPGFAAIVDPARFLEVTKPSLQAKMLYGGRYQVSVGDLFIFLNARRKLDARAVGSSEVVIHDIFPSIETRMGFTDTTLCKAFDKALAELKASGEYDRIYERHLNVLLEK